MIYVYRPSPAYVHEWRYAFHPGLVLMNLVDSMACEACEPLELRIGSGTNVPETFSVWANLGTLLPHKTIFSARG